MKQVNDLQVGSPYKFTCAGREYTGRYLGFHGGHHTFNHLIDIETGEPPDEYHPINDTLISWDNVIFYDMPEAAGGRPRKNKGKKMSNKRKRTFRRKRTMRRRS